MFFSRQIFLIACSILILVSLSGMSGTPPVDAGPEIQISTPSYPVGMSSRETKLIPYNLTESGNISGTITSRTYQFYTQFDVPLSDLLGPYPASIPVKPLQISKWKEPVYLPESVVNKARAMEEYAIVLKTTFTGETATGADFNAEASLLLLLNPASFSKSAPANKAIEQPVNPGLDWNASVGAIDYEYCLDGINNNSCDTKWIGSYESNAALQNLPLSTTFYWQVRANNTAGTTYANNGAWWSFTTCSHYAVTVTNIDNAGAGSLRQAIADICPGGTIRFSSSLAGRIITLASTLAINKDLTIDGSGLASRITLSGGNQHRILQSLSPAQVIIQSLGFSRASAAFGGAIHNTGDLTVRNSIFSDNAASNGSAIYNEGSLRLIRSTLVRNSATNQGGGIFNSANATLIITNSIFEQNSAFDGGGMITTLGSQTTITGSTFHNNTASSSGGAILIFPGTVTIRNSTFFRNSAPQAGAIGNNNGTLSVTNSSFSENTAEQGGAIANGGILNYANTILANSISVSDCVNYGSIGTNTNNLVESNTASPNDCGTPALSSDPLLGPLADNGGSALTLALLPGSPAIDTGDDASCPAADQRGLTRPQGSHCDIGAYEANGSIDIRIGGAVEDSHNVIPGESKRVNYRGVNDGPLQIAHTSDSSILAAERVIYRVNGINTSFSEMMGLPNKQVDTTYWLPWYNNKDLDTQLRFANVTDQPAQVHVYIGGAEMTGSPFALLAGESTRKSFPGINAGPVKIVSNVNIVAAERVIYKANGVNTSFTEMMALPNSQLDSTYWLPWYNNLDLDTQLRFANVTDQTATVHVYIGGQEMEGSPFTLLAGESTRQSFPGISSGPVEIVSDQNIVAAERLIYKVNGKNASFSEMMALPNSQLDSTYWLPWYNNKDLDTQLRFANVHDTQIATVYVYVGGIEVPESPFILLPGTSLRQSFAGINDGPVQIVSDAPIVAAERLIYRVNGVNTSFSEMMALPDSQLDTIYWLPWYNSLDLDTQLRFGLP